MHQDLRGRPVADIAARLGRPIAARELPFRAGSVRYAAPLAGIPSLSKSAYLDRIGRPIPTEHSDIYVRDPRGERPTWKLH